MLKWILADSRFERPDDTKALREAHKLPNQSLVFVMQSILRSSASIDASQDIASLPQGPRSNGIGAIPGSVKDKVIIWDLQAAAFRFCTSSEAAGDQSIWLWAMDGPYGVITSHAERE